MTLKKNKYFVLFGNCLPVNGATRGTICDLQKNKFFLVPNDLIEITKRTKSESLNKLYEEFGSDNKSTLEEYFKFLEDNELGFITDSPELFPEISEEWKHPGEISNSIIDFNEELFDTFDYSQVITALENLGCKSIQFRSFGIVSKSHIWKLCSCLQNSRIKDVKFLFEDGSLSTNEMEDLIENHARISEIILFNTQNDEQLKIKGVTIFKLTIKNLTKNSCGTICPSNFAINIPHFTEAKNYNTCLNKKISIDETGAIKNCPSQSKSFGNIKTDSLIDVVYDEKFKFLWQIKKDDIDICKSCEFRYICTDCRIFIENEDDIYSKPKKCNYNPFLAKWE